MSFIETADTLSFALSYLAAQRIYRASDDNYEINQDSWNKAMFDAHQAINELVEMGQGVVISASFCSVANATFFFSPYDDFSEHEAVLDVVLQQVINYGDVSINDSDDDEDQVYEFTAEKEHLMNCLGVELAN
jgi:hypothetical protein